MLPIAAAGGLILWLVVAHFRTDVPGIAVSRTTAEANAKAALTAQGTQLDSSWTILSRVSGEPTEEDVFVWRRGGSRSYQVLLGAYLPPPHWVVRFARFQGDVAQRAEEYQVAVSGTTGRAYRVRHQLPEAMPGATLTQDEARDLALSTVRREFGVPEKDLTEISAEAKKRPARGDWSVEYKDNRDYGLPEGEPRLAVEITGDRVADVTRYVHVPEEWERNERSRRNFPDILSVALSVMTIGIIVAGTIIAAIRWSRGQGFSDRALRWIGGTILLVGLVNIPNNWRSTTSTLQTAQPYAVQAGMALVIGLVSAFVIAGALALVSGFLADEYSRIPQSKLFLLTGVSLGVVIAGFRALATAFAPSLEPSWPDFAAAGSSIPLLAAALNPFSTFVTLLLLLSSPGSLPCLAPSPKKRSAALHQSSTEGERARSRLLAPIFARSSSVRSAMRCMQALIADTLLLRNTCPFSGRTKVEPEPTASETSNGNPAIPNSCTTNPHGS